MPYRTIFDAQLQRLDWSGVIDFGVFAACYFILLLWAKRMVKLRRWAWMALRGGFVAAAVVLAVMGIESYQEFLICRRASTGEGVKVVEGRVGAFIPMPLEGHAEESFVVDGTKFSYSGYEGGCWFHHAAANGGPIREGLQVRVHYWNSKILKVEVAP